MNRKAILSLLAAACVAALSACGSAAPTVTISKNDTNPTAPAASNDNGSTPLVPNTSGGNTTGPAALACSPGSQSASLTPEVTEGPYFKAGSPERASLLEDGMPGTKVVITDFATDSITDSRTPSRTSPRTHGLRHGPTDETDETFARLTLLPLIPYPISVRIQ